MHLTSARRLSAIVCGIAVTSFLTAVPTNAAQPDRLTVAADGSGQFQTVQAAIDAVPTNSPDQITIEIKPGTYRGVVNIPSSKPNIRLAGLGSDPADVVIVENHSAGTVRPDGTAYGTSGSATATISGAGFSAHNLTIANDFDEAANTDKPGHQAVALNLASDRAVLTNVRLLGNQDTFLLKDSARAYIRTSYIAGDVDFIFGGGIAVFDRSEIHTESRGGSVTAASTPAERAYGFLFVQSRFTSTAPAGSTTLGRPWRAAGQVVVRDSVLGAHIRTTQPWTDMSGNTWQAARFAEYKNIGPGSGVNANRPQLTDPQAAGYTAAKYLAGTDGWNPLQGNAVPTWSDTPDGFASLAGGTTGGRGGATVTVNNQADLVRYAAATEPYVIRVAATIPISPRGTMIRVASNKTIVGVGTSGQIAYGGFYVTTGMRNVIIRNLTIRDTLMPDDDPGDKVYDYDAIRLDTADHIWIDHNHLTRMNDGLLDSRKDTTYLTVSWNILSDNNKSFGIGWTPNLTAQMTIHHNWIYNSIQRNPSIDNVARAHLYNNYLQNVSSYGNYVRGLTKAVIENSYFDTVHNPYYVEAGELVQRGNRTVNCTWSDGLVTEKGAAFDPSAFYSYTLDPVENVPALLRSQSGPQATIGI
jgi:pectin methylesterase-like acyl-CoA thioesterase